MQSCWNGCRYNQQCQTIYHPVFHSDASVDFRHFNKLHIFSVLSLPPSLCSPEAWSFIGPDVTTVFIFGQCFKARPRHLRTGLWALNTVFMTYWLTYTKTHTLIVRFMGIAGFAPLAACSVTPEWICVLTSTAWCSLYRSCLNSCRKCSTNGHVWSAGVQYLCAIAALVVLFQGNPCVSNYPVGKANTDLNVFAQGPDLDHCRRIWLKCVPLETSAHLRGEPRRAGSRIYVCISVQCAKMK